MFSIGHRITALAAAGVLCVGTSRSGMAQMADETRTVIVDTVNVTVYRAKEPVEVPLTKAETVGRPPAAGAVRVPGFWDLQGDRMTAPRAGWVWVPGRWLTPPFRGAQWNPAHWGFADGWWSWIPGHWQKR